MANKIWATYTDSVDVGCRVVKWDEPDGLDLHKAPYTKRNLSYNDLKKAVKQFTIHWSATYRAKHTHNGLIARGLSCNFSIDDDNVNGFATIYQHLPIVHAAYSQGAGFNILGPGVEVAYQPAAYQEDWYDPNDRKKWNVPEHTSVVAPIHGTKMKVHLPTEAQMKSIKELTLGVCKLFPDLPGTFPRDAAGNISSTITSNPLNYKGLVGHFHLRRDKIDPAGLDFASIEAYVKAHR